MDHFFEILRDQNTHAAAWRCQNDEYPAHFHASIEMMYVEEGSLIAVQEQAEVVIPAGGVFLNASYLLHSYRSPEPSREIVVTVPLEAVGALRERLRGKRFGQNLYTGARSGDIRDLIDLMTRLDADDPAQADVLDALAGALVRLVVACVGLQDAAAGRPGLVRAMLEYIHSHLDGDISMAALARTFGYSVSRLSHIFNAHVGCSLPRYVDGLRCGIARELLRQEDLTIVDVALRAGFNNVRTFYRAYRREYGHTPRRAAD